MHASVDGSYEISKSFAGNFHEINSRILFLGGASKLKNLPGVRTVQNFHGCLKNVQYTVGSLTLHILDIAKTGSSLISESGDVLYDKCVPVLQVEPISNTVTVGRHIAREIYCIKYQLSVCDIPYN
ncbi:Nrx-1 [Bugula neritina]|uniref:Nrx-1 n=1 Tax=Bugula neritina TaxID=10212 RepID=A0A7J7KDU8_BUGNE|nr:Nrx-1 [Bugula neritina]